MSINPEVSVIIPAYNCEKYIEKTVASVASQSFKDLEIIIVDDGSTDQTYETIENIAKNDTRIKLFSQKNGGASKARNKGINEASGNYIAILDSDDLWHEDKIKLQYEAITLNDVGMVSCHSVIIDKEEIPFGGYQRENLNGYCYEDLLVSNGIGNGSVPLILKECFDKVGLFDEDIRYCEDWDMWIRIAKEYKLLTISEVLVGYRRMESNLTRASDNAYKYYLQTLSNHIKKDGDKRLYDEGVQKLNYSLVVMGVIDKNYLDSWRYLWKTFALNPVLFFKLGKKLMWSVVLVLCSIFPFSRSFLLYKLIMNPKSNNNSKYCAGNYFNRSMT